MFARAWRTTKCRARLRCSTNYLAASPARSNAASCRTAPPVRRRWPLLRASAELLNAANGVRPLGRQGYVTLPVFAFGWPTTENAPLLLSGSVLDALRSGLRRDFAGRRGKVALALTALAWALLWIIHRWDVRSEPPLEAALRDALGEDYASVAAQSQPAVAARRRAGVIRTSW